MIASIRAESPKLRGTDTAHPERPSSDWEQGGVVANPTIVQWPKKTPKVPCNDEAVRAVYLGRDGVLAAAKPGAVVLDMSTVSPTTSRQVNAEGVKLGLKGMGVAISGRTPAVDQGTITLLAGGDEDVFDAAAPIFDAVARQYFLLGPSGSGTSMKLVVNTLLGIGMQAVAEPIALGVAEGLDRKRLLDVLGADRSDRSGPQGQAGESGQTTTTARSLGWPS